MLRGDDVADLQTRLGDLGFFADRVDGILGPQTAAAITTSSATRADRRRHLRSRHRRRPAPGPPAHLAVGQGRGGRTRAAAQRVPPARRPHPGRSSSSGPPTLRWPPRSRALQDQGAVVAAWTHPDPSAQAAEANGFQADVYLGVDPSTSRAAAARTTAAPTTSRPEGAGWPNDWPRCSPMPSTAPPGTTHPMQLPVLRETRMVAVWCEIGPPARWSGRRRPSLEAVVQCLVDWLRHRSS